MRVALAGKGGAGKTTISATLARVEAARGRSVVAIDADSNPNLAIALGIDPDVVWPSLPHSLVSRRQDGSALTKPLAAVLDAHGVTGPDDVRVLFMGAPVHAEAGCLCSAHAIVSAVLADLNDAPDTLAVVDFEASPEHLSRGTARHVDVLLLVAEPYYRSLEAVARLATLARELSIPTLGVVANKIRSAADADAVREFCERHELGLMSTIAWSDDVLEADRLARPLFDVFPTGPTVGAVTDLSAALRALSCTNSQRSN
ncbi:MAG: carbon monoxide dehydrogenase accessory protein CooC [Acidimicrobiales bacterium]